jgi:hypothetical protein
VIKLKACVANGARSVAPRETRAELGSATYLNPKGNSVPQNHVTGGFGAIYQVILPFVCLIGT